MRKKTGNLRTKLAKPLFFNRQDDRVAKIHRSPSGITSVERRKLVLKIQAWYEIELIGETEHERYILDETCFLQDVQAKIPH